MLHRVTMIPITRALARGPGVVKKTPGVSAVHHHRPQSVVSSQRHYFRRVQYEYYGSKMGGDRDRLALSGLIGFNFLVYFSWHYGFPLSRSTLNDYFVATTWGVFGPDQNFVSLLGAAFSHVEGYHLLANMMTFYFFGRDVFYSVGARFAVPMYLIAGLAASYAQVYQGRRNRFNAQVIGASGAVSSFVIFSILANPSQTILLWFFLPVPAALFGIAYIMQDIWGISNRQTHRGMLVGHEAHLVGSAIGGAAFLLARRRRLV